MNCTNCGTQLSAGEQFCHACGNPVSNAQFCQTCGAQLLAGHPVCVRCGSPVGQQPVNAFRQEEADKLASSALTFGIMGVIFSLSFFLSILGVIFSAIAMSKAKKYKVMTGTFLGKAGVGRGLGIGGLISGIIFSVFSVLWFFMIFVAILMG